MTITQELIEAIDNKFGFTIGKYNVGYVQVDGVTVGTVGLRFADHSMNGQNKSENYMLSVVIGRENATDNKFLVDDSTTEQVYYKELTGETISHILIDMDKFIFDQFGFWLADGREFEIIFK
jgi:hypothetical protein